MSEATPTGAERTTRQQGMEAVEQRRKAELEIEIGEKITPEAGQEKSEVETEPQKISNEDQIASQLGDALDPSKYNETKVRVKVDGVEQDLPISEVIASYQKNDAASRRLNEATAEAKRIVAEAETMAEARRKAAEDALRSAQQQQEKPKSDEDKAKLKAKYKELTEAQFTGDIDRAADIQMEIDEMRSAPVKQAAPSVDLNAIVDELAPRITQKVSLESAYAQFESDYSDVVGNPMLNSMAVTKFRELTASGKDPRTAFKESGDFVRSEVKKIAAQYGMTESKTPDAAQDKLKRKEAAAPAAAVTGATVKPPEIPQPQSRSSVLDEMRKSRGQGPLP